MVTQNMDNKPDKKKKKSRKLLKNGVVIGSGINSVAQKRGEAASQFVQAYNGRRYDSSGNDLHHQGRSLKHISHYKVNPKYKKKNIIQQAGFDAELLQEARYNHDAILQGDYKRIRTTDGIGETNNPQFDHVQVDENNQLISGSGTQMKFMARGYDKKLDCESFKVIDRLAMDEKWDRYGNHVQVPKGEAEAAKIYADKKAALLKRQAASLREKGKLQEAKRKEYLAERYERAGQRVEDSKVTRREAIDARLRPEKVVAQEILKDSHTAGMISLKAGAATSALMSMVSHSVSVARGDEDITTATKKVGQDVVKAGATAYGITFSATALKSVMAASKYQVIRKTSGATGNIVGCTLEIGKAITRYARGQIDSRELILELGEKGVGAMTSTYASACGTALGTGIGTAILPGIGSAVGGFIGGAIGGMIGYTFSGITYHSIFQTLEQEKMAREQRIYLENLSNELMKANALYQQEIERYAHRIITKRRIVLLMLFRDLDNSILNNDCNAYARTMNKIGEFFGARLQFKTIEDFDDFMNSDKPLIL